MKRLISYIVMLLFCASVILAEPMIEDVSAQCVGRLTIIEGTVYDSQTLEALPKVRVEIHCNDKLVKKIKTDKEGFYSFKKWNFISQCKAGDDAWIRVFYQDRWWESGHVTVEQQDYQDYGGIDAFVGVPEFSTVTLGMAVIGGCLGLVVLRRKQ